MNASRIVDAMLETGDPYAKKRFELEYRPFFVNKEWRWFWILHPEDKMRAAAHGEADSRGKAAIEARKVARKLGGIIAKIYRSDV